MKTLEIHSSSSEGGHDTDTTENVKEEHKVKWTDVIGFFNGIPLMAIFFYSWYYLNHNVMISIWSLYVLAPILDIILPIDEKNLSKGVSEAFEKDIKFLVPLYVYMILDFFIYFWALYQFTYGEFYGTMDRINLLIAVGTLAAIGMVIGHELLHRRQLVHKIFGTLCYSKVLYSHFFIEHVKGHHKNVATPLDPATSKMNQTLYQYLPQTIFGSYKSVWNYEQNRLRKEKNPVKKLLMNRLIIFNICHVLWVTLVAYFFGILGLTFVLVYAMISIFYLETINYIEHYGLKRHKDENGVYEPVNIKHSWNAPHRYTNYILFKLQRHSDHHANAYKPYQILNSYADSPTLLGGYSVALITCIFPSVWFKAYNPLVKAAMEERQVTKEEKSECEKVIYQHLAYVSTVLTFVVYVLF